MLLKLVELVLGLSPAVLWLLVLCISLLALCLLSIIAFFPTGASRLIRFVERFQHLLDRKRRYTKRRTRKSRRRRV
jgi:hypothetical protein